VETVEDQVTEQKPRDAAGPRSREVGISAGINIAPGSDDDGWVVPPPVTLSDGTRVQLYKDGEALHAAYNAIKAAKHRVCLEVYIFASDDTGRAFADLLSAKAREGVRVFLIYDSFGSFASDKSIFLQMRRAGVDIRAFNPVRPWDCKYAWRPFNRDHRKLLIIDYDKAGMGGLNVGGNYAGSWVVQSSTLCPSDFWRDNAIGIAGPGAKVLLRAFRQTWRYINTGGSVRKAELVHNMEPQDPDHPTAPEIGPPELGLMASVPARSSPLVPMMRKLFRSSQKSIEMTMAYFAPSDELVDELVRAARRRVRVRLMLPNRCDVPILITAARSFYEDLMEAGVEIYERKYAILHAKTMVIDRRLSIIGSTNLDYRSIEYNLESSALIRSEEFGEQVHSLFENDVCYADRVRLKEYRRRRSLRDRLTQWAVKRARYIL
jgi:cardiolipin synthase